MVCQNRASSCHQLCNITSNFSLAGWQCRWRVQVQSATSLLGSSACDVRHLPNHSKQFAVLIRFGHEDNCRLIMRSHESQMLGKPPLCRHPCTTTEHLPCRVQKIYSIMTDLVPEKRDSSRIHTKGCARRQLTHACCRPDSCKGRLRPSWLLSRALSCRIVFARVSVEVRIFAQQARHRAPRGCGSQQK